MADTIDQGRLLAQRLMAVTGIFPTGKHPTDADMLASMALPAKFEARAKRWLHGPSKEGYERRKFEAPEPTDADKLQDKILDPISPEDEAQIRSAFTDPMEGDAYLESIANAKGYIDSKWPKIPVPGSVAQVFPLSSEELEDVFSLVRVAEDPEILFNELEAESLSVEMIDCARACYPDLFSETLVMIDRLVIDLIASGKDLTWQQNDLVHMLHGVGLESPIEIAKAQPKQQNQEVKK